MNQPTLLTLLALLTLTVHAATPARAELRPLPEPADPSLPSIWLIGDSTVRNGWGDGGNGQWGWGEPLVELFDPTQVNVVNRAVGGLSSRTYMTSGYWDATRQLIRPGDVVLMQFGHNDAAPLNDDSRARGTIRGNGDESETIDNQLTGKREVVHSYGWYLRRYVADIRRRGATPIICSLVPRKSWNDQQKINRAGSSYAGYARDAAEQSQTQFIDLNALIADEYDQLGPAAVEPLFGDKHTHTSRAGAELNARCVLAGLKALDGDSIEPLLGSEAKPLPPADAERVADFREKQATADH